MKKWSVKTIILESILLSKLSHSCAISQDVLFNLLTSAVSQHISEAMLVEEVASCLTLILTSEAHWASRLTFCVSVSISVNQGYSRVNSRIFI